MKIQNLASIDHTLRMILHQEHALITFIMNVKVMKTGK